MAADDRLFAGSIPEIYDRLMVPLIFEPYAHDLAARIARLQPKDLLETAAGTGVLTRAIVSSLPEQTRIVASDLNQPMLDHAAMRQPDAHRVSWQKADALALPFGDRQFDIVACQFGAMFFPDKVSGYSEALRVLRPRGTFLFNVWDRIADNEFADVVTGALAKLFPRDPPLFMARTPHGYCNAERIRTELIEAGFAGVSIDAVDHKSRAASAMDAATAYCQGTPLRNEIEARAASGLADATKAAADALEHRFGSGAIEGRIRALVIAATV